MPASCKRLDALTYLSIAVPLGVGYQPELPFWVQRAHQKKYPMRTALIPFTESFNQYVLGINRRSSSSSAAAAAVVYGLPEIAGSPTDFSLLPPIPLRDYRPVQGKARAWLDHATTQKWLHGGGG